jgi:NAD(P)-dependent dehydrogenase (short-subunit alcohol dehydrogenase family)
LALHAFRNPDRCPDVPGAWIGQADIRQAGQIRAFCGEVLARFEDLEAMIWAVGATVEGPVIGLKGEEVREVLAVNLTGFFLTCQALAPRFLQRRSGTILAVSSHAGLSGRRGGAPYAMAQSGLLALVRSLAREWGTSGIRLNAVIPPFMPDSDLGRQASAGFIRSVRSSEVFPAKGDPAQATADFIAALLAHPTSSGQVFVLDSRI